ncbi:MAG: hypothetical protein E7319_10585 [Clostridiales bacterium]|nr:hypothetical protein [Clostridiales bacterium]
MTLCRYQTFGDTLTRLMKKYQLTASALGAQLGCKAALRRALNEDISDAKRRELYRAICALHLFSPEEETELKGSICVSKLGLSRYLYLTALNQLLYSGSCASQDTYWLDSGVTLSDFLTGISPEAEISIICINCVFPAILDAFHALLKDPTRRAEIRHYIAAAEPDRSISQYLLYTKELIFDERYIPFIPGKIFDNTAHLPIDGNMLIIRSRSGEHEQEYFFIIKTGNSLYQFLGGNCKGTYHFYRTLLDSPDSSVPLRTGARPPVDYSNTCLDLLGYELNRKTLVLSPDLSMALVPPSIVRSSIAEGGSGNSHTARLLLDRMESLHAKRYDYTQLSRKERALLFAPDCLKRFLHTGRLIDHCAEMRAFTPSERLLIINAMLTHLEQNPNLSIHLFKMHPKQLQLQVRCHEKLGVTLYRDSSDNPHLLPYVTLQSETLANEMADYLLYSRTTHCMSREESIDWLKRVRDEYAKCLEENHIIA